ncbi:hypothetical protein TTHERM_000621079 (macronuclear) [Tetrahymena thermophila SB210]|uniref:Uncharacterized protein n=1 Tax=Tetrahymena thermophila (strain SB210) TaxID=312017 RepID=W7X996_TETTS|nr:hypothetical protein TTHERM_000621079 [Tetrahymena thermophila SB210]EWS73922.1 hypothetical protein TTHERM_000621079 [Tetrahymena thermophila SB210]|eukprot:XP_012653544.1 hypothetical protein TTHERM_000621079 [Tetrahymena thermophila SB210]
MQNITKLMLYQLYRANYTGLVSQSVSNQVNTQITSKGYLFICLISTYNHYRSFIVSSSKMNYITPDQSITFSVITPIQVQKKVNSIILLDVMLLIKQRRFTLMILFFNSQYKYYQTLHIQQSIYYQKKKILFVFKEDCSQNEKKKKNL